LRIAVNPYGDTPSGETFEKCSVLVKVKKTQTVTPSRGTGVEFHGGGRNPAMARLKISRIET